MQKTPKRIRTERPGRWLHYIDDNRDISKNKRLRELANKIKEDENKNG